MKKRMASIFIGAVASLLIIMLTIMMATSVHADSADAMWVDPGTNLLDQSSIGTSFNITISLNMTEDIYGYQVSLHYNRTIFRCTRVGFTGGLTSNYCSGHTTIQGGPTIDGTALGNGSVQIGESLLGNDLIPGPHDGSLVWIEFLVQNFTTLLPPSGNLTTTFDISTEYLPQNSNTYVLASDGSTSLTFTPTDAQAIMTPEFPYLLILPVFMALTLACAIFSRRQLQKKLK